MSLDSKAWKSQALSSNLYGGVVEESVGGCSVRGKLTKNQQIAADLRTEIESGALAPGEAIPSEAQLMERYGFSRETVRAGVRTLVEEGLVTTGWGQGKYVREAYPPVIWDWSTMESRRRHEADGSKVGDQWASAVAADGHKPRQEVRVSIVEPPKRIRDLLQLGEDGLAVVRQRVRYVDNLPYALSDSYMPESLVAGTPLMEPRDVHAPGGVLASVGLIQVKYRDEIAVRMPTREEAEKLSLPVATPVAEHTRTGYDEDGKPLRCMVTILPGDRHVIRYEVDAD